MNITFPRARRAALQFFPDGSLTDLEAIGGGHINDTFLSRWEDGRAIVLQRLNRDIFTDPEAVMRNWSAVADYLASADYPYLIPAPLSAPDGRVWAVDPGGDFWRAFPYFDGTYTPDGKPDPAIAFEAAKAYGLFIRALRDFPVGKLVETIPGFHDTSLRWERYRQTLQSDPCGRAASAAAEIEKLDQIKPLFDRIHHLKKRLPLRVTHNDTKAANILFYQNTARAAAVIDLDTVMPGVVLSDFGDMVRSFSVAGREEGAEPPRPDPAVLSALEKGFLEGLDDLLVPEEREHLREGGGWIVGEQALRFLSDYLAGDAYYKTNYPEQNLERARFQLGVYELLK